MPWGKIIKALSGYYYVLPEEVAEYDEKLLIQCRARGVFRKNGKTPLVGDYVAYECGSKQDEGTVVEIGARKNSLLRPPVANVDQAVLVFSVDQPIFSPLLLDRFLVHTEKAKIPALICISKSDLANWEAIKMMLRPYDDLGYPLVVTSAKEERGIEQIYQFLLDKVSVFAGQSGVGKSSLLNSLIPRLNLKTSEISQRLGRGRHTTRHVELLSIAKNSWVADTPGFSQLDFTDIQPEELSHYFIEMRERGQNCKFRGCLHDREPQCAIRAAVEEGEISQSRYQHYLQFLTEVKDAKQRRY